jgi:hypothetical protein
MLTYKERIELRDKLVNGEIGIELAKAQYWDDFKEGQRSWHTKDWEERRDKFIKDKCQICGSKDTLTLQHLSHPRKYSEYLTEIRRAFAKDYIDANREIDKSEFVAHIIDKYDYVPNPLCPNCRGSSLIKRKQKLPIYRCPKCHHEFDDTVIKSVDELISIFYEDEEDVEVREKCFISRQWGTRNNLSNFRYWLQRERSNTKGAPTIEKEAFLLYLNDDIKYLSFEDTITACKRCASYHDLYRMELCPHCKEHYKGFQYPTCIQCLPEEKRKAALESIEFGMMMRDIHGNLGVD